ncbi:MAG: hypothetical protein ACFFEY_12605 [Candidatus Thorarchaeota archaeon]
MAEQLITPFATFDGKTLSSICRKYQDDNGVDVDLIAVVHIGEKRYYDDLLDYIGQRKCIYEQIEVNVPNNLKRNEQPSNLDFLSTEYTAAENFWNQNKKLVEKFTNKYFSRTLKRKLEQIETNYLNADIRLRMIFEICKKTMFNILNLGIIQKYLGELLELSFQFHVIDYINDIPKRRNWERIDMNLKGHTDLSQVLPDLTKEEINAYLEEANVILTHLAEIYSLHSIPEVSERRVILANSIMNYLSSPEDERTKQVTRLFVVNRNKLIEAKLSELTHFNNEITILYGALHMPSLEEFLFNQGFKFKSEKPFTVFSII